MAGRLQRHTHQSRGDKPQEVHSRVEEHFGLRRYADRRKLARKLAAHTVLKDVGIVGLMERSEPEGG